MLARLGPGLRRWVAAVAAGLCLTGPAAAQAPRPGGGDLLDEARRREAVAVQKVEADFRAAIAELHRLAASNPARAAERLKRVLAVLEADAVLPEAKREAWKRMVKERVRVLEAEATGAARAEADAADRQALAEERKGADGRKAAEDARVREKVDEARRLHKDGRFAEAGRVAEEVARQNPGNPAAGAAQRVTTTADRLAQLRQMRREKDRAFDLALTDAERSATPLDGEIKFPSRERWQEITKLRAKPKMTEKEQRLMQALDAPITVNFKGSTLETALDYLQTLTGQTIVLDKVTLDAAGVTYGTPVNTSVRNVATRTLLRKMLGELGLTYIIKDEAIQVVTPQQAKDTMTVRTYYIGDLAATVDVTWGPVYAQQQMTQRVNEIIQMITGSIDPDSWQSNNQGGRGTIVFDPKTMSLIVKQSAEVHYMLSGGR